MDFCHQPCDIQMLWGGKLTLRILARPRGPAHGSVCGPTLIRPRVPMTPSGFSESTYLPSLAFHDAAEPRSPREGQHPPGGGGRSITAAGRGAESSRQCLEHGVVLSECLAPALLAFLQGTQQRKRRMPGQSRCRPHQAAVHGLPQRGPQETGLSREHWLRRNRVRRKELSSWLTLASCSDLTSEAGARALLGVLGPHTAKATRRKPGVFVFPQASCFLPCPSLPGSTLISFSIVPS